MKRPESSLSIGLIILSADFRVVGMNEYARGLLEPAMKDIGMNVLRYHPRKSHEKVSGILKELRNPGMNEPVAMVIDVLNKVFMINLCRVDMMKEPAMIAMTFIDITEQTGAEKNPVSGMVELKRLPVYEDGACRFISTELVHYIEADGNYCKVRTEDRSYHLHLSLKAILQRYTGRRFYRVHKSFIVNLEHVRAVGKASDGQASAVFDKIAVQPVPVSRRRLGELKQALQLG
jgi:DNA-binding LytR/AlgR family response regulator